MNTPDDLTKKVCAWLERSGYSLEMAAASTFRSAGYSAVQSDFYEDPSSGELRETDVVAYAVETAGDVSITLQVVCECKVSQHPWVLLSTTRYFPKYSAVRRRPATKLGTKALTALARKRAIQDLAVFQMPKYVGYSLVTAALGNAKAPKDLAYEAIWSVGKATSALVAAQENDDELTVGWPLVVLRGQLFAATLDEQSKVHAEAIDHGVLAWRNPVLGSHSLITVVTEAALPSLVANLRDSWTSFAASADGSLNLSERSEPVA